MTASVSPFAARLLDQLLRLRAGGALPLVETAPGSGVWRWGFRAGGQPVTTDLDTTVCELRCYHDRDEVSMSPVRPGTMEMLLGKAPMPGDVPKTTEADGVAEMRRIIKDWREDNPRLYMRPPVKVGHPDNWNRA
jgi:hypothetical protein